ncbi:MAG: uncharacterized protein QOG91_228 [Candidatus Parcubacteria bacterium]|nr:uncharacterized protein [Candidatus Parcubacteria bacterium]
MKKLSSSRSALGVGVVAVIIVVLVAYVIFSKSSEMTGSLGEEANSALQSPTSSPTVSVQAPQGTISALVADTPQSKEKGLGGRASLPANQGMLFVFSEPGMQAFWMKDMKFSLDMVWIGADKKIVGVSADISPDSYPQIFLPPSPVLYVLELNAGATKKYALQAGTALIF